MRDLVSKVIIRCATVLLSLMVCGCGTNKVSEQEQQAYVTAATAAPRLQAGEKIRVTVFGEDKLSGEYDIDPSGLVSLPLAGTVKAAGLTQAELEAQLATKFRSEYLKNPKVTVAIAAYRPFYIMGEVERPGEYAYKSGLNVLSAAAMAGGTTYRASRTSVLIQRAGETTMREYPLATTVPILPGDLIRIPERYF